MVIDTHGDLGNLTLSAVCAADAVLTVFTSDPGSALGAARVTAFLDQHRQLREHPAQLLGVACSLWDKDGKAAREVLGALEGTGLPLLPTRIPMSRRVPTATLAKRPVVLSSPVVPVAEAYASSPRTSSSAYASERDLMSNLRDDLQGRPPGRPRSARRSPPTVVEPEPLAG